MGGMALENYIKISRSDFADEALEKKACPRKASQSRGGSYSSASSYSAAWQTAIKQALRLKWYFQRDFPGPTPVMCAFLREFFLPLSPNRQTGLMRNFVVERQVRSLLSVITCIVRRRKLKVNRDLFPLFYLSLTLKVESVRKI